MQNIVIFGASGAIGKAFCQTLAARYPAATLHAVSRHAVDFAQANIISHALDFDDETAIAALLDAIAQTVPIDCAIVAVGVLHHAAGLAPEKTLHSIHADALHNAFHVNTVIPTLLAKYTLPKLNRNAKSVFAVLSARVGSISDNRLGGWYAYRMAKAALNMAVKTLSIELRRKNPQAVVVALHPGTVASALSQPFQKNVAKGKLFDAKYSVNALLNVLDGLSADDTGKIWAWDGQEILP